MATKQKKKLCVYCRSPHNLDHDHIPPKSLFPPPRPENLITVPCCPKCHKEFNENDAYFRNYLIFSPQCSWHPAARQLKEVGLRSLQDSNVGEPSNPYIHTVDKFFHTMSHSGLAPGLGTTVTVDDDRIGDAVVRIVVGLFWVENKKYLPDDYEVEVIGSYDTEYSNWPVQQSVHRLLSVVEPVNIGDGVFQYWWSWDKQAPPGEAHQSDWLLRFYEGTTFLCRIARPQKNVSPSHQWASILPG